MCGRVRARVNVKIIELSYAEGVAVDSSFGMNRARNHAVFVVHLLFIWDIDFSLARFPSGMIQWNMWMLLITDNGRTVRFGLLRLGCILEHAASYRSSQQPPRAVISTGYVIVEPGQPPAKCERVSSNVHDTSPGQLATEYIPVDLIPAITFFDRRHYNESLYSAFRNSLWKV